MMCHTLRDRLNTNAQKTGKTRYNGEEKNKQTHRRLERLGTMAERKINLEKDKNDSNTESRRPLARVVSTTT